MKIAFLYLILLIYCLSSCTALKRSPVLKPSNNYCEPALTYAYDSSYRPQPVLLTDTILTNHFSRHDLLTANAAGILPLLEQLNRIPQNGDVNARIERLTKYQQIQNRLMLASTEIASLAAELACEVERAEQLAVYLDGRDQKRIRTLTLVSLILGAATTVATTALLHTDGSNKVVGIGGGVISASLGGAAAFSSDKSVTFLHRRNLLTDIWEESAQSTNYPPLVWYVLNEKLFSNSGQTTIRANIRQRWRSYELADTSPQRQQLYFGAGGEYQAGDLHVRANMLDQLQASVRSINQDLQSLLIYVGR